MDILAIFIILMLVTLSLYWNHNKTKKDKDEKDDLFWFQLGVYGLYTAHAERCDTFEDNIYLGYHCNEIVKTYEKLFPEEKYKLLEKQHLETVSSKSIADQVIMADSIKRRLLSNGFKKLSN
jgi:hypothetical protein